MHQFNHSLNNKPLRQPIFIINNLTFTYPNGHNALEEIQLVVNAGDRLALVGHNGSGKSTLAKHLNGLLNGSPGSVLYKGGDLEGNRLTSARLEVGLLFQDPDDHLFCNTLFEDVAFGPMNKGLARKQVCVIVEKYLRLTGLWDKRDTGAHFLSYGQKKRAALAAILAMEPETLILDEPTANLDPQQVGIITEIINNFTGTLICISHDLFFLRKICSRALVLEKGQVHHDFTLRELMDAPDALRDHGLDYTFRYTCCRTFDDDQGNLPEPDRYLRRCSAATEETNGPIIELEDYSFRFSDGTRGLKALTFQVNKGECLALVGENGAGKSTLAGCLAGFNTGTGRYIFDGSIIDAKRRRNLWMDVGMIFQDSADQLFCPTCRDEVAFGLKQRKLPAAEIFHKVDMALDRVNLSGYADRSPLDLSGGERKRLAIASVLCLEPRVLIMDEPTAGLDPAGEKMFFDILEQLSMTRILISHDMFFVRNHCRRVMVLHQGRLLSHGKTEHFFADMKLTTGNRLDYSLNVCGLHHGHV